MIKVYPVDNNKVWTGEEIVQSIKSPINGFLESPPDLIGTEVAMRMGSNQVVLPTYPNIAPRKEPLPPVPVEVTMRQARLALLGAGLLSQIESAINAIEDQTTKAAVQIEQEYAQTVNREHSQVKEIINQLELTEDQVNGLFITASKL